MFRRRPHFGGAPHDERIAHPMSTFLECAHLRPRVRAPLLLPTVDCAASARGVLGKPAETPRCLGDEQQRGGIVRIRD
jgi:hypothetical protein